VLRFHREEHIMSGRTWDALLAFLYELPSQLKPGRQRNQTSRDSLQALIDQKVLPHLNQQDKSRLFPLGFSPSESDLKIASGIGLERQLITAQEYEHALRTDKAASPFGFLQNRSGKTFGETVAPLIAQFWLAEEDDTFTKRKNTELYDIGWIPHETNREIRIELKASSEIHPRFQQIRHPRMTDINAVEPEYDVLLCVGVSNDGLEWWSFAAHDVDALIFNGTFTPQHSGTKADSGTFWTTLNPAKRQLLQPNEHGSEQLRAALIDASSY
jgi:hypothetical protein